MLPNCQTAVSRGTSGIAELSDASKRSQGTIVLFKECGIRHEDSSVLLSYFCLQSELCPPDAGLPQAKGLHHGGGVVIMMKKPKVSCRLKFFLPWSRTPDNHTYNRGSPVAKPAAVAVLLRRIWSIGVKENRTYFLFVYYL